MGAALWAWGSSAKPAAGEGQWEETGHASSFLGYS